MSSVGQPPKKSALKNSASNLGSSSSNMKSKTGVSKTKSGEKDKSSKKSFSSSNVADKSRNANRIFDGQDDVTPLPLLDVGEPSVLQSNVSDTDARSDAGSESAGFSGMSKSGWGSSGESTPRNDDDDMTDDFTETTKAKKPAGPMVIMLQDEWPTKQADRVREKEREITVVLSETSTVFLLDIPSSCVADDDEHLKQVQAKNAEYAAFVKQKAGQDKYSDRAMQTIKPASKNKDAQATPAPCASIGVDATNYEIHDAIEALKNNTNTNEDDLVGSSNKTSGEGKNLASLTGDTGSNALEKAVYESPKFKEALMAAERIVIQNIYHKKQVMYRDTKPAVSDTNTLSDTKPRGASLGHLFTFEDLLAVGYGQFEFSKQADGLVLFWSLKHPEYPHKVYRTECSVTSLAFANKSANLLAVGLYDGTVGVYDVRKPEDKFVLESSFTSGKHSDAVWEVVWVDKGNERGETLVSVSSDGRVTQWTMSKGLENSDLIKLKRVASNKKPPQPAAGVSQTNPKKKEAFISRMASGMCANFNPRDPSFYIVGTEEGFVHKCSVSYNEQYLETYRGHSGPIYKVGWSPFLSSAFMSCSADWSIKVWHQDTDTPMLTLQSSSPDTSTGGAADTNASPADSAVGDIDWSPNISTIFASVTADGLVNIWDMSVSTLDPVVQERRLDENGRVIVPWCVRFSPNGNVVVAGDKSGSVTVYKLSGVDSSKYSPKEQVERLEKALAAKDNAEEAPH